jgi:chromosome segregation ATPase
MLFNSVLLKAQDVEHMNRKELRTYLGSLNREIDSTALVINMLNKEISLCENISEAVRADIKSIDDSLISKQVIIDNTRNDIRLERKKAEELNAQESELKHSVEELNKELNVCMIFFDSLSLVLEPISNTQLNEESIESVNKSKSKADSNEKDKKSTSSSYISFSSAERFVYKRIGEMNGSMLDGYTNTTMGSDIHVFLVSIDGSACVIAVSEYALDVLASDCGGEEKIREYYLAKELN